MSMKISSRVVVAIAALWLALGSAYAEDDEGRSLEELEQATEFGLFVTSWKEQGARPLAPGLIGAAPIQPLDPELLRLRREARAALGAAPVPPRSP